MTKVLPVMKPQLSTDFELVIMRLSRLTVSPTFILGYRAMINQLVALVDIHLQSVIYCWTVLIYMMSDKDTSLLPVSEICLFA